MNGYRQTGPRKQHLINTAKMHIMHLAQKGINPYMLMKVLGISKLDANKTTTKQWSGVIGRIVEFRKDNHV